MSLTLESRFHTDQTPTFELPGGGIAMISPALGEDYWAYRVKLSERQAIIGFPKFGTIGIGFAVEDADWNTNLPYTVETERIATHIAENKGDPAITDDDVRQAIMAVQLAAATDKAAGLW